MCWIIDILTRLLFNCTFPLKTCDILLRSTRARLAFLTRFVLQHPASCGQFGQSDSQQTASMVLRLQGPVNFRHPWIFVSRTGCSPVVSPSLFSITIASHPKYPLLWYWACSHMASVHSSLIRHSDSFPSKRSSDAFSVQTLRPRTLSEVRKSS